MTIDPEAALALAVQECAPRAADNLMLLLLTARSEAPAGEADAWEAATRAAWVRDMDALGDKIVNHVHATQEQAHAFSAAFAAAVQARFVELRAGISTPAGRA